MEEFKKILVVDDEADLVFLIKTRLENDRYKVIVAADGEEALKKVKSENPDLVVLDLILPGVGGYELCAKIKADEKTAHIPVLMLSARAGDIDKKMGLQCGADAYLFKPFNGDVLLKEIARLLE